MGIVKRQSFYTTIISYMGLGIGFFNTVWLYPHILQPQQYGLTELLFALAIVATQFSSLGMNSVILRYFPYFNNPEEKHHGFLTFALAVPIAGFTVIALLGLLFQSYIVEAFQDKSELFAEYYLLLIPFTLFLILFETLAAYSRSLLKTVAPTFLRDLFIKLYRLVLILVYLALDFEFYLFVILYISGYALQFILLLLILIRSKDIAFSFKSSIYQKFLTKNLITFGLFSLLSLASIILISKIDTIMVGSHLSLSFVAIYSVAYYIGNIIEVPGRSISAISLPILADAWKRKDVILIERIYKKTAQNQLLIGLLLFLLVWLNIDVLFSFLPPAYQIAKLVVLYIAIAKICDLATGTNGSIIGLSKYFRTDLYFNVVLVALTIFTNSLLIPKKGIEGAAIATAISIFLYNLMKYTYVWYRFGFQPFTKKTLYIFLLGSMIYLIFQFFPDFTNRYILIVLKSLAILFSYILIAFTIGIADDLRDMILKGTRKAKEIFR